MTEHRRSRHGSIRYELRLQGHLDQHWSSWFTGLTLTHNEDGTTSLNGTLADQAELHGLLAKVRDLGATLISVTSTHGASRHKSEDNANRTEDPTAERREPGSTTRADAPAAADPVHTHPGGQP